ncbi:metalloregulator ArsR/SmtB family transcription factor [Cytophagaceae bacterium ABcell3]|nr:metalloregulator ArsR/SmtB family transcription factor [Cytophagaceae bacterium ABcell3]
MGVTKKELFSTAQNNLSTIAKVLGHPARVAIVEYLVQCKQCITGDIVQETGLAQATISQHLRELKNIGIIKGSIEGTSVCYCIDEKKWDEIKKLFTDFFDKYPQKNTCC